MSTTATAWKYVLKKNSCLQT